MSLPHFGWAQRGGFEYLHNTEFLSRGIEHGFIGSGSDFSEHGKARYLQAFKDQFGVSDLLLLNQVHGAQVLEYRQGISDLTGDALIIPFSELRPGTRTAFGIRVADCLSALYIGSQGVALVHAGWKGLAAGIHLRTYQNLQELQPSSQISSALFPCASLACYEVGEEVITSFADKPVAQDDKNGKFHLGLRETAQAALSDFSGSNAYIDVCAECTISDPRFHSYRRDGISSGRNLLFVVL
ncbi:MAG: polyphenol oxidase family protein [Deltaproteobacteria bacterium]|nr:polyphenol oxidase family protein [Deltaproteobacteria bacterium]